MARQPNRHAPANEPAPKRARGHPRREEIEEFLTYVMSLKGMLRANETLDVSVLAALARQVTKQLRHERFMLYACEQSCSRNIEFVLNVIKDQLIGLLSHSKTTAETERIEDADTSADDEDEPTNEMKKSGTIRGLITLWETILGSVYRASVELSENQYGSRTVEHILENVKEILSHKAEFEATFRADSCANLQKIWEDIAASVFNAADMKEFWRVANDVRATYLIRKMAEFIDLTPTSAAGFVDFCRGLFATSWPKLHNEVYKHEKSSPTFQAVLLMYAKLETDEDLIASFKRSVLPEPAPCIELVKESPPANRMVEFILMNKLCDESQPSGLYAAMFDKSSVEEIMTSPLRHLLMSLLASYSCQTKYLVELIPHVDIQGELKLTRLMIKECGSREKPAKLLIDLIQNQVCKAHKIIVDWAAREKQLAGAPTTTPVIAEAPMQEVKQDTQQVTEKKKKKDKKDKKDKKECRNPNAAAAKQEVKDDDEMKAEASGESVPIKEENSAGEENAGCAETAIEGAFLKLSESTPCRQTNFWNLLFCLPGKSKTGISFQGGTIACDLVTHVKPKFLGAVLTNELEEMVQPGRKRYDIPIVKGGGDPEDLDWLLKIAHDKKGGLFLQLLLRDRLPEGVKKAVRLLVVQNCEAFVFNEYSSFLVTDVVESVCPKERQLLKNMLKPLISQIRLRNFALYKHAVEPLFNLGGRTSNYGADMAKRFHAAAKR